MANRHLSRSIVLQTLFEWDFNNRGDSKLKEILNKNIKEFGPGLTDFSFIKEMVEGIVNKLNDLDKIIVESAPDWPIERISIVDRNVLRIGLYELLFADRKDVPAKVAINEAIELAKSFGGDSSGKFINGVLGTVYKEIGEPGKDEVTEEKESKKEDDPSKYPIDKLVGVIVYSREKDGAYLAMVHDVFGYWTLCKGKMLPDEKPEDAAKRKVSEELGIEILNLKDNLGNSEYVASDPERGGVRKQVSYFLAEAKKSPLKLKKSGGLDEARWFPLKDIAELNMYDDITAIITEAVKVITKSHE